MITVATPSALVDILGVFKALDSSAKPIAVNFLHPYMNLKCLNQLIYHYYYSLHRHSHLGSRYSWLHYPSINNYYHQYLSPNLFRPDQFYLSDFPRKVVLSYTEIFLKQWVLLQEMDSFGIIKPCSEIGIINLLESQMSFFLTEEDVTIIRCRHVGFVPTPCRRDSNRSVRSPNRRRRQSAARCPDDPSGNSAFPFRPTWPLCACYRSPYFRMSRHYVPKNLHNEWIRCRRVRAPRSLYRRKVRYNTTPIPVNMNRRQVN